MSVVTVTPPARFGFHVRVGNDLIPVASLLDCAQRMVAARGTGKVFDVHARVTLTRERALTAAEAGTLIRFASELLHAQELAA